MSKDNVNEFGDKLEERFPISMMGSTRRVNSGTWNKINKIAENAIKDTASCVGTRIVEFGDADSIEAVSECVVKEVEKRIGKKIPVYGEKGEK